MFYCIKINYSYFNFNLVNILRFVLIFYNKLFYFVYFINSYQFFNDFFNFKFSYFFKKIFIFLSIFIIKLFICSLILMIIKQTLFNI